MTKLECLEARLARLERSARRSRSAMYAMLIAVITLGCAEASKRSGVYDVLRAKRDFVLAAVAAVYGDPCMFVVRFHSVSNP